MQKENIQALSCWLFELITESNIKINGLSNINESLSVHYLIYRIDNLEHGKYYIGQHLTSNPLDNYMGSGKYLLRSISKEGVEKFVKTILFDFDNFELMNEKEKELVPLSACYPYDKMSYNLKEGGSNGQFTDDTRKHLSTIRKGKFTGKNNPMYGIDVRTLMSPKAVKEMHRKISIALKNRKRKQETFDKISKANSGVNNPMYGKHGYDTPHYNKKCMYCQNTKTYLYVEKDKVNEYLSKGYILQGSNKNTKKSSLAKELNRQAHLGRKLMYHPITNDKKYLLPKDFLKYLDLGYLFWSK